MLDRERIPMPAGSTLLIALAALLWGVDLLLRPLVLAAGWSPARVVLGEHLLLTLAFAVPLWQGRHALARLTRSEWSALLLVSWGGSALATWLYTQAFTLGSPLPAVLLQKTQPFWALGLAGALLGERRAPGFWLWCALALVGAVLLTGAASLPSAHDLHWQQAACALAAAALWGAATVGGRLLSRSLSPSVLAGARFALAVPVLAALALVTPPGHLLPPAPGFLSPALALLLIVLLPDLLGMRLYYAGLRETPASVATLAELCYPLSALVIGVGVQHAIVGPGQWTGLALLLTAVLGLGARPGVAIPQSPVPAPSRVS